MKRFWCSPVKYDDEWNTSDEETDDSTWIGEFDLS